MLEKLAKVGGEELIKIAIRSAFRPYKYLSKAAEGTKSVPLIGTIIGVIISSTVNTLTTATLCHKVIFFY